MRARRAAGWALGFAPALGLWGGPACAAAVAADPPSDVAVTIYRSPIRSAGNMDLANLTGFALVTETRTVHLPAGEAQLRFEGVADGIEPASALVSGLPHGVIEKNRDAQLLSPAALVAATVGKSVTLVRTSRKTGKREQLPGTLISGADGGVVFQSAEGIEALRCSGLPETFSFDPVADLSARPTLSVLVRSAKAFTATVTLSYLAHDFDWAANYTATLSNDATHIDLGAWITLANSNGSSFPAARLNVVAGHVNHDSGEVEPIGLGGPVLAGCWPRGSTSDVPMLLTFTRSLRFNADAAMAAPAPMAARLQSVVVTAQKKVEQEELGDLKLYRIPERTTVSSRQSKQIRLLDRAAIPVTLIYDAVVNGDAVAVRRLLRTKNAVANHLGLPLPSGAIDVFSQAGDQSLLQSESRIQDLALDEDVEIGLGPSTDVRAAVTPVSESADSHRVDITNARAAAIHCELRVPLPPGVRVARADHAMALKNGQPIFTMTVPANGVVTLRYRTTHQDPKELRR